MKKLIAISILMFGMNVNAQDTECKVKIVVTVFDIKGMLYLSESKSIEPTDVIRKSNASIYSLNPSQDYIFTFRDDQRSKTFMLKTSDVCGHIFDVNVIMSKNGSLATYWENDEYQDIHFMDAVIKK